MFSRFRSTLRASHFSVIVGFLRGSVGDDKYRFPNDSPNEENRSAADDHSLGSAPTDEHRYAAPGLPFK
jgi:hypothetical protein